MKRIITLWLSTLALVWGVLEVVPYKQIVVNGNAKDITIEGNILTIGTDTGRLIRYDFHLHKVIEEVELPPIVDFVGDTIPPRILSVDALGGRLLMVSESGKGGYTNLFIHENNTTTQLLTHEDQKVIVKGRFIDKEHILLGYLSNEAALYHIPTKKEIYRVQLSESKFSDFALNEEKTQAVFGCESGQLSLIDTKNGKLLTTFEGVNNDNTYKVAYKNGTITTAGQDRRGGIYDVATKKGSFIEGSFLIYATALSPSGSLVAFAMDEQNNISIYDRATHEKNAILRGQKSTLNAILFVDEKTLFSASDDNTIIMWQLQ